MKKLLILFMLLFAISIEAQEYKVVFDCSSGDAAYIKTRMWLIGKTIDMFEKDGDSVDVALTLHGSCVAITSMNYELIVPDEDMDNIKKAQEYLVSLSKRKNIAMTVCAMSLAKNAIIKDDVLPFMHISPNSYLDTIKYQNDGYALMSFK
ncbi:DsrE family protein [Sulfurimonas sp. SAG-AH-194-L11]|nr:DsrE family protein [Sulfurimonas sp. SAG-AH-194-L11]MDF1876223.1 DsrE family protein [Sulfurimonas sp. SAG-AH-194-L11]